MIKWIISDMDGTLIVNDNKLPQDFDEIMEMLKARHIMFSPASGRQLGALLRHFRKYKDDFIFIAENGTLVTQGGKELFSATLPEHIVRRVIDIVAQMPDIHLVLSGKRTSYINYRDPKLIEELSIYYTQYEIVDSFEQVDCSEIIKIAICDGIHHQARENIYEPLRQALGPEPDCQIVLSSGVWVDVIPLNVNKGVAIRKLQQKLNIKPEECVAFGDYLNDYEMLQAVGNSYAMENAIPEIKAIAKYIAPPNTEAGVTKTIRKLLADQDAGKL